IKGELEVWAHAPHLRFRGGAAVIENDGVMVRSLEASNAYQGSFETNPLFRKLFITKGIVVPNVPDQKLSDLHWRRDVLLLRSRGFPGVLRSLRLGRGDEKRSL